MLARGLKSQQGLTLIEILVAISLFSLILLVVIDIFSMSQRSERRILTEQKVLAEGQLIMAKITQQVRTRLIEYSPSWPTGIINHELHLTDDLNSQIYFRQGDSADLGSGCPAGVVHCVEVSFDGGASWESLTSDSLEVSKLIFYVYPLEDPFEMSEEGYASNIQPRVTIYLELNSTLPDAPDSLFLQTTASSRVYKR
ncbi:MAG: type II secretion system protein [Patescibacteria group bacterium]